MKASDFHENQSFITLTYEVETSDLSSSYQLAASWSPTEVSLTVNGKKSDASWADTVDCRPLVVH